QERNRRTPGSPLFCRKEHVMAKHNLVAFKKSASESAELQKETPMRRVLKVLVVVSVGLGLGGTARVEGASHGGHHGSGHAGAAHGGHHGGGHAGAAHGGHHGGGDAGAAHGGHRGGSHAGAAHGGQRGGSHAGAAHGSYHRNYYLMYGRQFRQGYYYPGR